MRPTLGDALDITDIGFEFVEKKISIKVDSWYPTNSGIICRTDKDGYVYMSEFGECSLDFPLDEQDISDVEATSVDESGIELITVSQNQNTVKAHYEDGAKIWSRSINSPTKVMAPSNDLLVVVSAHGELFGLDLNFDGIQTFSREDLKYNNIDYLEGNSTHIIIASGNEVTSLTTDNSINYTYNFDKDITDVAAVGEFCLVKTDNKLYCLNNSGDIEFTLDVDICHLSSASDVVHFTSRSELYVVTSTGSYSAVLNNFSDSVCQLEPSGLVCIERNNYLRLYKRSSDFLDLKTEIHEKSDHIEFLIHNTTNHTYDQITLILNGVEVDGMPGVQEFDIYDILPGTSDSLSISATESDATISIEYQNEVINEIDVSKFTPSKKTKSSTQEKTESREGSQEIQSYEDVCDLLDGKKTDNNHKSTNKTESNETDSSDQRFNIDIFEEEDKIEMALHDENDELNSAIRVNIINKDDTVEFKIKYNDEVTDTKVFDKDIFLDRFDSKSKSINVTDSQNSSSEDNKPESNNKCTEDRIPPAQKITGGTPPTGTNQKKKANKDNSTSNDSNEQNSRKKINSSRTFENSNSKPDLSQSESDLSSKRSHTQDVNHSVIETPRSPSTIQNDQNTSESNNTISVADLEPIANTDTFDVTRIYYRGNWAWDKHPELSIKKCTENTINTHVGEPIIEKIIINNHKNVDEIEVENIWDEESKAVIKSSGDAINHNGTIELYSTIAFRSECVVDLPARVFYDPESDKKYYVENKHNCKKIRVESYHRNHLPPQCHYIKNPSSEIESNIFIRFPWDVPSGQITNLQKSPTSQANCGTIEESTGGNDKWLFEGTEAKIDQNIQFKNDKSNGNGLSYSYELKCPDVSTKFPTLIHTVIPLIHEGPNYSGSNLPDRVVDGLNREDEIKPNTDF